MLTSLTWKLGYVRASGNNIGTIATSGNYYSYSNIINLGPAGSTISFTDDNTNSNGDTNFASSGAYVFSFWTLSDTTWSFDSTANNKNGSTADYVADGNARTYSYTSTADNECIRLSFRSGQLSDFTPAAFPTVTVNSTAVPTVVLDTTWNAGYVGSSSNTSHPNEIYAGSGYVYSDVIHLAKKGTKVAFTAPSTCKPSTAAYILSYWDATGATLNTSAANYAGAPSDLLTTSGSNVIFSYISAGDNEYIRLCVKTSADAAPVVYLSAATEEDSISEKDKLNAWIEADKDRAYYNILEGKTVSFIGDSYFRGNGLDTDFVWPAILANKYSMVYTNEGKNGSTMSNYVTNKNPMVDRYTDLPLNNPDIIVIEGGRNDYNQKVPIGTDGSSDTTTMKGAVRYLITKLQERYPNALIIAVTCWETGSSANTAGHTCSDYGNAMIKVCEDMGVACINAMDTEKMGVDMTDATFRSTYCMSAGDVSHLNAEGMKLVFPVFEKYIADFYTAAQA